MQIDAVDGKGTITCVRVSGASEWGDDILAIGTFIRNAEANLYNFYVVDPSEQQVLRYSPAADGSGFPNQPNKYLSSARDVGKITSMYIDGDVWLADDGQVLRVVGGNSAGWTAAAMRDVILRGTVQYRYLASGSDRRAGTIYAAANGWEGVGSAARCRWAAFPPSTIAALKWTTCASSRRWSSTG